ncbi:hypothetical protein OG497_37610 [Streptomyces sp. NBC_01242]|uniref:hypothetical protein n=1 Tax=Streptomyces sp. NBC_01242 TaxID=2903795 RepID=UPI00225BF728|nr:hypothetical protein [Streptomyces sp. NBC_01242]MCX4799575.1 hypothetical protein [Streptomyces sp. NBC_01242]
MAGLTKDEAASQREDAPADSFDPFGGDSQCFTWNRAVMVGQLQDELAETVGPEVRVAMLFPRDGEGQEIEVGPQNPITVYVTPSSADLVAVRQVMGAHRPDRYYGLTDNERQDAQLREKIASGADLTQDEMQRAFRLLIS